MKMCLAPCYKGCTDERYGEESAAVESFLATRGESRLVTLRTQREAASADLEFETAAALHAQVQRVEGVRALAAELVRPLSQLRAVIVQASANPEEVAVFLYESGRLRGPAQFSTLGMRIQNEQSGSTSLFPQPMAMEPIPENTEIRNQGSEIRKSLAEDHLKGTGLSPYNEPVQQSGALAPGGIQTAPPSKTARSVLEARMEAALAELADSNQTPSPTLRQGHMALLKRWYYRPEARRTGEIFFPDAEGRWPVKAMLRGVGRVAASIIKPSA
jgi:excinuclease UvrABC nuclease subunit